jgi:hypothetical protein
MGPGHYSVEEHGEKLKIKFWPKPGVPEYGFVVALLLVAGVGAAARWHISKSSTVFGVSLAALFVILWLISAIYEQFWPTYIEIDGERLKRSLVITRQYVRRTFPLRDISGIAHVAASPDPVHPLNTPGILFDWKRQPCFIPTWLSEADGERVIQLIVSRYPKLQAPTVAVRSPGASS